MADQQGKFDPFKPAQPRIPGVVDAPAAPPAEPEPAKPAPRGKLPPQWIAIGAAVIGIVLGWLLLRTSPSSAPAADSQPVTASAASAPSDPAASAASSPTTVLPEVTPIYPDEVASIEEMNKPWASKRFTFMKKIALGPAPALLVRLPAGSARTADSYWAFGVRTRYGKCDLELVTDLNRLRGDFGYNAQHPMVVEPCTNTVFDPLRRGTANGAWVRGEVVQGSSLRPPLMIEVQIKVNRILAVQME